ncbi:MAG: hypothetical protein M5T52_24570 [Ignavibacteriaceae bacterium]|nr:hypothetical protein [Ignavibacteriaceae bacterium]
MKIIWEVLEVQSYFWTTGQILKGAYLEDHHDPATNAGGWFNGWTPSSAHFWDGDCGDGCMTPIYASDPVINAYQKH